MKKTVTVFKSDPFIVSDPGDEQIGCSIIKS